MNSRSIVPLAGEDWKDIPSLQDRYQASSLGRIRRVFGCNRYPCCSIPFIRDNRRGYFILRIKTKGVAKWKSVHSLVAEAFIGPRPKDLVVNHKDGIKTNNTPDNLEYVTVGENNAHAHRIGLHGPNGFTKRKQNRCSSEHIGVYWHIRDKAWIAQIKFQGKKHYIGIFVDEREAARAYVKARSICERSKIGDSFCLPSLGKGPHGRLRTTSPKANPPLTNESRPPCRSQSC